MNKLSKIKGKIADKKINALGVLVFLIFLSIAPVQAGSVIIDSCPSGATVYLGSTTGWKIIGVTPFSYLAPAVQTGLTFKKQYYGTMYSYVGPNTISGAKTPLYYWGGEPGNTNPVGWNFCTTPTQTPTQYKAPAPTPTPYVPTPTQTPTQISGSATINSVPSGADVYLATNSGPVKLGVTPFVYTLPSTQRVISFKKSGYKDRIAYISPSTKSPFVVYMSN